MSVETSNAPRRVWVRKDDWYGSWLSATPRDPGAGAVEYLRRDLVVPTVDEIAEGLYRAENFDGPPLAELGIDGHDYQAMAELVHGWLLSRIEGTTDA